MVNKKSVLIVEDDAVLASLWQDYLRSKEYSVDSCSTVSDAEVLLHSNQYSVVIVDIFLDSDGEFSGSGGITLINRIRLNTTYKKNADTSLPILAVSGGFYSSKGATAILDNIERLADRSLQKPIPLATLEREIAEICAK